MPKDKRDPKPASTSAETTFAIELTIPSKYLADISKTVPGEDPISAKVAFVAEGAILDLCEGGMVLNAPVVKKLNEAFGGVVQEEDLIEQFSRGVGRKDGKLQITISLDPAYESVAQQAADFQGSTVPQLLQNAWDTAWDNGDFYDPRGRVDRVVMPAEAKKELVSILGKDFSTGTELATLIKAYANEHEGLFEDVR